MAIKSFRPHTPSRRYMTVTSFEGITNKKPEKALTEHQTSTGGRNTDGRITSRFRGGGHKQRYRLIDWKRNRVGIPAKVA